MFTRQRRAHVWLPIIVITATTIVLAAVMWFAWQSDTVRQALHLKTNNNAAISTNNSIVVDDQATINAVPSNTGGWKDFTALDSAYSVQYPSTYQAEHCSDGRDVFNVLPQGATTLCDGLYQGIFIQPRSESSVNDAVANDIAAATNPIKTSAKINGQDATVLTWTEQPAMGGVGRSWTVYYIHEPFGVYEIANSDISLASIFSDFLSTVKFATAAQ